MSWSQKETAYLRNNWDKYMGHEKGIIPLAKQLGRSTESVRAKALRMGLYRTPNGIGVLTIAQVGALFGRSKNSVLRWIRIGHFAPLKPHNRRAFYAFTVDELWDWMEQPHTWHLWKPDTLKDWAWREHFTELRAGWIDKHEAAQIIVCTPNHVVELAYHGKLPALRFARATWVRREHVAQYARRVAA